MADENLEETPLVKQLRAKAKADEKALASLTKEMRTYQAKDALSSLKVTNLVTAAPLASTDIDLTDPEAVTAWVDSNKALYNFGIQAQGDGNNAEGDESSASTGAKQVPAQAQEALTAAALMQFLQSGGSRANVRGPIDPKDPLASADFTGKFSVQDIVNTANETIRESRANG